MQYVANATHCFISTQYGVRSTPAAPPTRRRGRRRALALLGLARTDSTLHDTALYADDRPHRSLLDKNDPIRQVRHARRRAEMFRPRVAHCIVCPGRWTMDHPMIYQNYEAHVLSQIGASSDVYFVLDGPTDATDLYEPIAVAYEEVEGMYFQYRRWIKCLSLVKDHEDATNARYSHVIFQRADQVVLQDVPSIETFPTSTIWSKPYGENMDEYLPVYTTGDDNAQPPHVVWFGIADLFLIMSRQVAFDLVHEVLTIYTEWGTTARVTCGPKGWVHINSPPEKTLKCAASRRAIPVVHQNFQLRLLRPHEKKGCHFFRSHHSKHYNSLCI